jgi:hypothetical protein
VNLGVSVVFFYLFGLGIWHPYNPAMLGKTFMKPRDFTRKVRSKKQDENTLASYLLPLVSILWLKTGKWFLSASHRFNDDLKIRRLQTTQVVVRRSRNNLKTRFFATLRMTLRVIFKSFNRIGAFAPNQVLLN